MPRLRPSHGLLPLSLAVVIFLFAWKDFTSEARRRQQAALHLAGELVALSARPDPERRRRLTDEILAEPALPRRGLAREMIASGVTQDSWLRGTTPAAVVVGNATSQPRVAALGLLCSAPPGGAAGRVRIEDGLTTREVACDAAGSAYVELPPVAPGASRLFIVQTPGIGPSDDPRSGAHGVRIVAGNRVLRRLEELRRTRDPQRWAQAAETLAGDPYTEGAPLADPRLSALNLSSDLWTYGVLPGAILAVNPDPKGFVPRLKVSGPSAAEVYPLTVTIDDGTRIEQLVLERPGGRLFRLARVRPRSKRLFVVWADKSWSSASDVRRLGIRLRSAPPPAPRPTRTESE